MNMDMQTFKTDIQFDIQPIWQDTQPQIRVVLDEIAIWSGCLAEPKHFNITQNLSPQNHVLQIEMHGKPPDDAHQAVVLKDLLFGGIASTKFLYKARYMPDYPEPWASQQRSQGHALPPVILAADYLGWNGIWQLDFSVPIFRWIHAVEDLGWIYE